MVSLMKKKTPTFYHFYGTYLEERSLYLPLETKDRTTQRLQHVPLTTHTYLHEHLQTTKSWRKKYASLIIKHMSWANFFFFLLPLVISEVRSICASSNFPQESSNKMLQIPNHYYLFICSLQFQLELLFQTVWVVCSGIGVFSWRSVRWIPQHKHV